MIVYLYGSVGARLIGCARLLPLGQKMRRVARQRNVYQYRLSRSISFRMDMVISMAMEKMTIAITFP